MLELKELKEKHDKAYAHGQISRERSADDLVFYWITQWDDTLLSESPLQYRGQFDMLRKAGRDIMADLRSNPVSVEFNPKDDDADDAADFLNGMYLTDDRDNSSIEAFDNATSESVVCGVGAWILYTEYESLRSSDNNQVIKRKPVYEANNNLLWDPNAKLKDKSDANFCSILWAYSEEAYEDLVEELTGEKEGFSEASFSEPEQSYTFPWVSGGASKKIYVVEFYQREIVKDKLLTFVDALEDEKEILESRLSDYEDDLIETGYDLASEKDIRRYEVTKYIASGADILSSEVIAGEHIPVIPTYGECTHVEGEPHWEGVTRLAKDPQRLRNFQMSYLADIVSRSPRNKPIITPEQIRGFEFMWEEQGADNNYPFLYQNLKDEDGAALPIGPVAQLPDQTIPAALMASIELTAQAITDVANPGVPQDIADPSLSGKAVIALQNKLDQQSMVYQQNYKHAKRRDAEVYASIATVIIDSPRRIRTTKSDGSSSMTKSMQMKIDEKTGMPKLENDISGMEFDVYADVGPSYSSKREQTLEQIDKTIAQLPPGDPMLQMLTLKKLELMPGVSFDDVRDYARKQLILGGYKEPETEEEKAMVQQQQQAQQEQSDPNDKIAQAEMLKGQADVINAETTKIKTQADIEAKQSDLLIKSYDSETKRFQAQTAADVADSTLQLKAQDQVARQVRERQSDLRVRVQ